MPVLAPLNDSNRFDIPSTQSYQIKSPASRKVSGAADPLLSDLSPAAVLDVLRNNGTSSSTSGSKERILVDSIAEASQHEIALGIRAALIGKRMKDWITELQSWDWPQNGFESPLNNVEGIFWGAFPSSEVMKKEQRLELIKDDMSALEVEQLKNYVRSIHLHPQSRRTSGNSQMSFDSSQYNRLDDFHVLITAMIVQALPDLATLTRLLGNWSVRLLVLKQIPGFLRQLQDTRLALELAWATLSQIISPTARLSLTESTYKQIRGVLEDRVTDLARRIDAILDALEGSDDSVPDDWIDEMDETEIDYKNWVVEAEKFVKLHEWQTSKAQDVETLAPVILDIQQDVGISQITEGNRNNGILGEQHGELKEIFATTERVFQISTQPIFTSIDQGKDMFDVPHRGNVMGEAGHGLLVDLAPKRSLLSEKYEQDPDYEPTKVFAHSEEVASISKTTPARHTARKPVHLSLDMSRIVFDEAPKSNISAITTASSSGFTDMSSPQIFDASEIQYFKSPVDDQSPPIFTKDAEDIPSSTSTGFDASNRFKHGRSTSAAEPMTGSRESSLYSQVTIFTSEKEEPCLGSMKEKLNIVVSIKDDNQAAKESVFDTPPSPGIVDVSPTLNVRKLRMPLERLNPPGTLISGNVGNGHTAKQVEDKMTAKITRLLTKIPAPIRLAAHPSELEFESATDGKLHNQARQQRSITTALTLSPVTPKAKNTPSNDSGVRVYHLHQPGKDVPVKLFIRLVGSEERVMVRVGGGWADLAEYLKEYAVHHGRRSVSRNKVELKGLSTAQNTANSSFNANRSPVTSAAGTPNSKISSPANRPGPISNPQTPEANRQSDTTPSTESIRFRSASSVSTTNDESSSFVGLAGLKVKKVELSPQRKAWVDGMLTQARNISSEHRKGVEDIGDLGKVGSTKRIFFKGQVDNDTL